MQSRGPRVNDILSEREVNEIADSPRGLTLGPSKEAEQQKNEEDKFREDAEKATHAAPVPSRSVDDLTNEIRGFDQKIANLTQEGKVIFEKPDEKK